MTVCPTILMGRPDGPSWWQVLHPDGPTIIRIGHLDVGPAVWMGCRIIGRAIRMGRHDSTPYHPDGPS